MRDINTKKTSFILWYIFISLFVFCGVVYGEEGFSINVKETSKVNAEDIYLRDIADINAPSFLKNEIGIILIGTAPDPGEIKIILKDRLRSKINANHLIDKNVTIIVPEKIYVKRLTQTLEKDYVKEFLVKYIETFQEDKKFDLSDFSVRGIEPYPQGELSLLFARENKFSGKGRFSIRVDVLVNNNNVDKIFLSGWVDVYEQFVCARVPLLKNQKIEAHNLYYKSVNTTKLRNYFARNIENVAGKIPKNTIKKGNLLPVSLLEQPPLVYKGQAIKLIAKRDGLKIITAGISREDGITDDLIRVENLNSGKIVRGFVKGKSLVEVYY